MNEEDKSKFHPSQQEIRSFLEILTTSESDCVRELRILDTKLGTVSGYFNNNDKLIEAAMMYDGKVPGIYITVNPTNPDLLARANNRIVTHAKHTTSDTDIPKRSYLFLDFDPKRPTGIPSTDMEHEAAIMRAKSCWDRLEDIGWPAPILCDSGNGAYLLYRIDLPNDSASTELINRCLQVLAFLYDDDAVTIDQKVGNAARIMRVIGTLNCKGDGVAERPHRRSRLLEKPDQVLHVTREQLECLAKIVPEDPPSIRPASKSTFKLDDWIHKNNLTVISTGPWKEGRKWILSLCPWNPEHANRAAYIVQFSNGAIAAGCHHNGCKGNGWRELRKIVEPDWAPSTSIAPVDTDWGKIVPLDEFQLAKLPETLFPSWAGRFVHALSEATETPIELAAMMALSTISTSVGKKFKVQMKPGYQEPLNIWTCSALDSGNRKTAVVNECPNPILEWERGKAQELAPLIKEANSKRKSEEAIIASLRARLGKAKSEDRLQIMSEITELEAKLTEVPKLPRLWSADITPEKLGVVMYDNGESLALISDEGGIFDIMAGRYSRGIPNLDIFLQGHAGSSVRVDRGSRPTVQMLSPALTIGLSPQPCVLRGLANIQGFRGRGLLARFLFSLPKSTIGDRTGKTQPVPDEIKSEYCRGIRSLLDIDPGKDDEGFQITYSLRLSAEAYSHWEEFSRDIEHRMKDSGDLSQITDWAGKLPGAVARIAGLFHCADHAHSQPWAIDISAETMLRALRFSDVLISNALAVFGLMGIDETIEKARKILRWIKKEGRSMFTQRDCHYALKSSFQRVNQLCPALDVLIERYYIRPLKQESVPHRPSKVFEVNPTLETEK